jgi:hypothetical protein
MFATTDPEVSPLATFDARLQREVSQPGVDIGHWTLDVGHLKTKRQPGALGCRYGFYQPAGELGALQPLRGEDTRLVRECCYLDTLVGSVGRFALG